MIKPVVLYGQRILREKTTPFEKGSDVKQIIQDMMDTMKNANGAGLAGPQMNLGKRIFVVDIPFTDLTGAFINPTILKFFKETMDFDEACLSLPGIHGEVNRPFKMEMEWYDENWEYHKQTFEGLRSRVLQHEYDHLEGKLWIDHLDLKHGMKILNQLTDIENRAIEVNHPTI